VKSLDDDGVRGKLQVSEEITFRLDGIKWMLVFLLVGGGIFGNYYFGAQPLLYRVLGLLLIAVVAAGIASQTAKGNAFVGLARGARVEAGKVVWPNRQERNQTTLVVVGFILLMALVLWGLDALIGWLATFVIG
jgi:preprotein translocase subunit SecE